MKTLAPRYLVCLVMLMLATVPVLSALAWTPTVDPLSSDGTRAEGDIQEVNDETQSWRDARELVDGDTYYGHVDRVADPSDHFTVSAAQHEEVNVHVYVMGHDGIDEWISPAVTDPPSPPAPIMASTMLDCFIYHDPGTEYPLDGAFNYHYIRHYMLNIVAPMPGTHTYHINVTANWAWTPNNYTWDYRLELDVGAVPGIQAGEPVSDVLDMAGRDTRWYKVWADSGRELNGSFEILNFDEGDPGSRNVDIWVFPDDLGGYPRSLSWDWSAAPNEPVEPFSILATYGGLYYIKLRGMNHEATLPCSYTLEVTVQEVPAFPATGLSNVYFDRHRHDTDWYTFDMRANVDHPEKPGLWNEHAYFNMTEGADGEELPDFDLYLFGRVPTSRWLDLLDSSFRNDHATFQDIDRDPNKNTEHVSAAAYYNGTYYLEVNAFNNTGYYDLRMEVRDLLVSDENDLPEDAEEVTTGIKESYIHQSMDHYDWYKVETKDHIRVQFDSYKAYDMFNLSIFKHDVTGDRYTLLAGDWNVHFNYSSRVDESSNLIDVSVDLQELGLGASTYYISVLAAVATGLGTDPVSGRPFVYVTDGEAEANYELRIWTPGIGGGGVDVEPIPKDTVEEDTHLLDHLDLHDHFILRDPEEELRFKAVLIAGRGEVILEGSSLGLRAKEDFHGTTFVKVAAITTNYLSTSLLWEIEFTPVNDAPRTRVTEPPLVVTIPEDSIRTFDLGARVYDVDEGDSITVEVGPTGHITIDLDPDTLEMTLLGDQDWFGEELVDLTVRDTAGGALVLPVRFVVQNVADPPVLLRDLGRVEVNEDEVVTISLYDHIVDPDGDPLAVHISPDPFVSYLWDADTGLLTLVPAPDWYGGRILWVTATDPGGHHLQENLWLEVIPIPGPPEIVSVTPEASHVTIREGDALTFAVLKMYDEESSVAFYRWFVDGAFVGPSISFTYKPGIHDQGAHEVSVIVEDEEGLWDTMVWSVDVEDVPHAPEGGIATPPDGSTFKEGEPVPFVAFYHDADGDDLRYIWYINGQPVSEEPVFEKQLDAGNHKVTLQVSSDGDMVTEELEIVVVEEEGGASTGMFIVIAILGTIGVTVILFARRRVR